MKDEFLINRHGKQYVLFQGLLDEAHARGLKGIDTDLVQVPTPENGNVAVVKATVEMEDGRTFSGIGDASPDNVGRGIVPHIIRMAETRAKARALRDAVNVGATALEELSDGDDVPTPSVSEPAAATAGRTGSGASGRTAAPGSGRGRSGERPVSVVPDVPAREEEARGEEGKGSETAKRRRSSSGSGGKGANRKANKAQKDRIKDLAYHWKGEQGVPRLENRIGKSIDDLTVGEAEEWIERMTPKEDGAEGARKEA